MIIVITGTPGTGKTNISKRVARELDFDYVSINKVVDEFDLVLEKDKERKTKVVDTDRLKEKVNEMQLNNAVVDGHLGYFIDCDFCIVLRCRPDELKKRLESKDWDEKKINENLQAEILGSITIQALEKQGWDDVYEIDTTGKEKEEVVNNIKLLLEDKEEFEPGGIDWLEEYKEWLDE